MKDRNDADDLIQQVIDTLLDTDSPQELHREKWHLIQLLQRAIDKMTINPPHTNTKARPSAHQA